MSEFNAVEVLGMTMQPNDADAATIRDYLVALLETVWRKGESFSGKRPFGNSGWKYELFSALVSAGALKGDEDGYPDDAEMADAMIADAIRYLRDPTA